LASKVYCIGRVKFVAIVSKDNAPPITTNGENNEKVIEVPLTQ
jgi:hypothetical protein